MSDADDPVPSLSEAFAGQSGGLCGAAVPGALWLITGLHTGDVGFTVEVYDEDPPLDAVWEDVVEVSFHPVSERTSLVLWGGEGAWELDLARIDYRVRYCARGMDEGREPDRRGAGEPQAESYLLQFWPAPPRADRVVRQTSQNAAYWHRHARGLPPLPTPEQRAETERLARQAQERAAQEWRLHYERWQWGGRLPSKRLRGVGGRVHDVVRFDSDLVHALDTAGSQVQRAVALLAARRACEAAGLIGVSWVTQALTALAEGRPLPPPFDDMHQMSETVFSDPQVPSRWVLEAVPPERRTALAGISTPPERERDGMMCRRAPARRPAVHADVRCPHRDSVPVERDGPKAMTAPLTRSLYRTTVPTCTLTVLAALSSSGTCRGARPATWRSPGGPG
ncbi:hypothetical protein [Streptomyces sp. KS 21]|uniref:hypothetical protein n=1 Tax=Streptomyces sp. KS 21 TaxID=2485150 RepID=UPI00326396DB